MTVIAEKIKESDDIDNKELNFYCKNCIEIFGPETDEKYSVKNLRNFYCFLLQNMSLNDRNGYINDLIDCDFGGLNDNSYLEAIKFNVNSLKIMLMDGKIITDEIKEKIIEYFILLYYNTDNSSLDITFTNFVEQQFMNLIYLLIKPQMRKVNKKEEKDESKSLSNEENKSDSSKIMYEIHKKIVKMIENKEINREYLADFDMEFYIHQLNIFTDTNINIKIKNKLSGMQKVINKIGLYLLFLYIKNASEFEGDITDLSEILQHNFDSKWNQVFISIILNLLNKGVNFLNVFLLKEYKKACPFLGKEALKTIIEFLGEIKVRKERAEEGVDEEENEEGKGIEQEKFGGSRREGKISLREKEEDLKEGNEVKGIDDGMKKEGKKKRKGKLEKK